MFALNSSYLLNEWLADKPLSHWSYLNVDGGLWCYNILLLGACDAHEDACGPIWLQNFC